MCAQLCAQMRALGRHALRVALKYEWHSRGVSHDEICALMEYTRQVLAVCQTGTGLFSVASFIPLCAVHSRRTVGGYMLARTRRSGSQAWRPN